MTVAAALLKPLLHTGAHFACHSSSRRPDTRSAAPVALTSRAETAAHGTVGSGLVKNSHGQHAVDAPLPPPQDVHSTPHTWWLGLAHNAHVVAMAAAQSCAGGHLKQGAQQWHARAASAIPVLQAVQGCRASSTAEPHQLLMPQPACAQLSSRSSSPRQCTSSSHSARPIPSPKDPPRVAMPTVPRPSCGRAAGQSMTWMHCTCLWGARRCCAWQCPAQLLP